MVVGESFTITIFNSMKTHNLIIVSTAHLHPLEAKIINGFAYVANNECAMISTQDTMLEFYKNGDLVCLVDFLTQVKTKYNANYVLFDPDADVLENLKVYDW